MRPIGGEIELKSNDYNSYLTDSGRSSLRLFLRSEENSIKKFLIPDFFCSIIEDILIEENVNYSFYHVKSDFSIDYDHIIKSKYDVLYIINYFGEYINLDKLNLENKILVEDNVFLYEFENHSQAKNWFAFNSYRKISSLADGSLVKTNLVVNSLLINKEEAKFVSVKNTAKKIKHEFVHEKQHTEKAYLNLFVEGELLIDRQKEIYSISSKSLNLLFSNVQEQRLLNKRFNKLKNVVGENKSMKYPVYYSFFVFSTNNKKSFMSLMRDNNIFLPNFWPKTSQDNILYDNLISIPLFNNYNESEFDIMLKFIKKFLSK